MRFPIIRPGLLSAILILIIFISRKTVIKKNIIHLLVLIYVIYNTFSGIFYISNGIPFFVFYMEYSNSIFPILFFFIAYYATEEQETQFYKIFVYAGIFVIVVGFYYWVFPNEMYFNFLFRTIPNFTHKHYYLDMRMNSFLSSIDMGTLSSLLVAISLYNIMIKKKYLFNAVLFIIAICSSVLSMQRSSYAASIIVIMILSVYGFSNGKILKSMTLLIMISLFVGLSYLILIEEPIFFQQIYERFGTFSTALSERSESWVNAVENSPNILLGSGLGSVGHKALEFAKYYVRDGSYLKIIVEVGLIGFFLFICIVLLTYLKYLKGKNQSIRNICLITVFLFQAIGSNVLAFQVLLPVFWYSIGRIWVPQKRLLY